MSDNGWEQRAACAPQNRSARGKNLDWSSTDTHQKYRARAVCINECPVRKECMQFCLDQKFIHGVWGGADDYEIRRTLSVDAQGSPVERDRCPRCPYCLSRKLAIATSKSREGYKTMCTNCSLTWHMACIPTKLKSKRAS